MSRSLIDPAESLYNPRMALEILRFRLSQAVLLVGPLTSLVINPWGNFDPISVVKLTVISVMAFLLLFLILSNWRITFGVDSSLKIALGVFFASLLSTLLFSSAPISQQIWGMFGRNTGALAYASLGIILFATAVILDLNFYSQIVRVLIYTGIPMTIYCLIQISGNDPIGWSSFEAFGTLGNINFLSAFLGLVCVAILPSLVGDRRFTLRKTFLLVLLLTDLFIIQSTGSIQGIFVFAAGSTVVLFLKFKSDKILNFYQITFVSTVALAAIPTILGLVNKGPLAKYLFQNSIVLRADYWHAGLEMTQKNPFFGVGMDSYGDWYRELRGEITTLRGSPERTANTAHNIFLDLSSNGGLPLLLAYLVLLFLALRSSIRYYRDLDGRFDPVFSALLATWVGYQVQALVSINQIGVGIWGWLLTGALIGFGKAQSLREVPTHKPINRKQFRNKVLPAFASMMGITGASLGLFLAWFPLNADAQYFAASKTGDWTKIQRSVDSIGTTSWHISRTSELAYQKQAFDKSLEQAQKLVERYPRDFFGWRIILYLPNSSESMKIQAREKLHEMDPFNPEFKRQ